MTVEGATNTEVFLTYLEEVLCPALRPGQIVVLDNLCRHKNEAVRERIEACGLPPALFARLQPGLQPHRTRLLQAQSFLRKAKARTQESLEAAIAAGLATITAKTLTAGLNIASSHCPFNPSEIGCKNLGEGTALGMTRWCCQSSPRAADLPIAWHPKENTRT